MAIPKKIFQTYSSLAALHSDIRKNIEKIQENHPDWEYTFFSESDVADFISDNYGDYFLEMYQRIDPGYGGTRADLFRYLLLFKIGGVYLDVKSGLVKNLNQIIKSEDTFLLSHWGPDYKGWGQYPELEGKPEFQNWFIISVPEHPFLGATIGDVIENIERY
ncbi:glycosyltransferase, partial [Betaproteobacteria bacterium]|nr:glycosyltransferase [Betaproteobacteria bacterium]